MQAPNVRRYGGQARCIIASDKITKYLLDLDHIDGGPKAKFFIGGGFFPIPEALTEALKRHFRENKPTKPTSTLGGERLVIDAPMEVS